MRLITLFTAGVLATSAFAMDPEQPNPSPSPTAPPDASKEKARETEQAPSPSRSSVTPEASEGKAKPTDHAKAHAVSPTSSEAEKAKGEKQKDKKTATKVDARSQAAYGRLVATEIRRHTPNTSAREPGSVEVTFKIGESGRVVSQTIGRSSHPELAARVTKILASVKAPQPPGGSYSAHQVFNFH